MEYAYYEESFLSAKHLKSINNLKTQKMDQRDYSNELISRMISDACQLAFIWMRNKRLN